jgi:flagellar basal-body rod modification protein FlgD
MDISQINSVASSGTSAAATVASALSSRRAVQATPKDATTPTTKSSSSSAIDSSNITSDDFLTLLVSELKNQDPTQPTDPNQYITQLAQVNSLQQLISINQGIGTLDGAIVGPSSPSSGSSEPNVSASVAATVPETNAVTGSHSIAGQNAIWGGSTAS